MGTLTIAPAIPSGGSVRVGPFLWTPAVISHECLVAVVHGAGDPAVTANLIGAVPHDQIVRFDNNVGQRNVNPQMSVPGGKTKASMTIARRASAHEQHIGAGRLRHARGHLDRGSHTDPAHR